MDAGPATDGTLGPRRAGRMTRVIVDSFGSPTIRNDLKVFDQTFHYPAPPSLNVAWPAGQVPPHDPDDTDMVGWAGETTLDVEYAHTIAPGANILLVETPVSETEGVTGFPLVGNGGNRGISPGFPPFGPAGRCSGRPCGCRRSA